MSLLSPQLVAFIAVCTHKTVHKAAHSLNLTQTAVTQRIRALERSLKATLFRRTRIGMDLTKEGEALLRYTHAAQELEGQALAVIQGAGTLSEVELVVTAPTSIMHSRVIPQCVQVIKKFPKLLFQFDERDIDDRHLLLTRGECDLAILFEEQLSPQMRYHKLKPEQYVLVASSEWQDRSLAEIIANERIIDFNESDQMTFDYLRQYGLLDQAMLGRHFVNQTESLANLVSAGVGYTTLSKEFVSKYVNKNKLIILNEGKTLDIVPVLAWFDRPEPPDYFTQTVDSIIQG